MKFDLRKKVIEFLKENIDKKFTANEIANNIIKKYPSECREKQNSSTQKNISIGSQISAEIGTRIKEDVKENIIKVTSERPKKYYYTEKSDEEEVKEINGKEIVDRKGNFYNNEYDLYPILIEYLKQSGLIAKRIDERKGSKKNESGSNKWLYPDVVAVENLTKDWNNTTKECAKDYSIKKTKLYSYEVKKILNRSNIREAYFQAVSNSTWANFGYLVATEINDNATKELEILNSLYGIGVIILKENIAESYIQLQAKEREDLDWNIINRLVEENSDFEIFINKISNFYRNGRDKTLEELLK